MSRMRKITLTVPGIPPNLNKFRTMHHYKEASEKKKWERYVLVAAMEKGICGKWRPISKSVVIYRFFFPDRRRRDPTNYYGAVKWLEDGLVKAGVIEDDSFDHTQPLVIKGGVDRGNPRVEIEVREVDDLCLVL